MFGWKLVPIDPAQQQVHAAYKDQPAAMNVGFAQAYRTMVENAPPAPVPPAAEPFIWICLVAANAEGDPDPDPRIRAWTANAARAAQLAEQGLDMVAVYRNPPARSSADTWDADCERMEKDFYATVGRYCTFGPPAERKRQWIILFEDADRGVMIFDDEREAHTAWDRAKDNWTCTLYETAHRKFVFAAGQLRPLNEPQRVVDTDAVRVAAIKECIARLDDLRCIPINSTNDRTEALKDAQVSLRALSLTRPEGK